MMCPEYRVQNTYWGGYGVDRVKIDAPAWKVDAAHEPVILIPSGSWTLFALQQGIPVLQNIPIQHRYVLSGSGLTAIDTAGAKLLLDQLFAQRILPGEVAIEAFPKDCLSILTLMRRRLEAAPSDISPAHSGAIIQAADCLIALGASGLNQLSFLGESIWRLGRLVFSPASFRFKDFIVQLERAGVRAIPIVALVNLLIGLVLAFLFSDQAVKYGASIFVIDSTGIGVCRELSPILTAIIVAGRSGSAFTAQIGAMKIGDEVDAIRVLGLFPMDVLVIPRICALVVALPLLTFIGDLFGIFGGVVIADALLGISPSTFFSRLHNVLAPRHVWLGLLKAPVFAFVVAVLSCRLGLLVKDNASSVGTNTTATVVQSIVAVILIDAAFAIVFQQLAL